VPIDVPSIPPPSIPPGADPPPCRVCPFCCPASRPGLGSLLALVSSGLTSSLAPGVLNFAHGALFMVGAYVAYVVLDATGSWFLALAAVLVFMLLVGWSSSVW